MADRNGYDEDLAGRLRRFAALGSGSVTFHTADGSEPWTAAAVDSRARRGAADLVARGLQPGDAVGVVGPNAAEWLTDAYAIWSLGAVVVPLPDVRAGSVEAAERRLAKLSTAAGCKLVLAAPGTPTELTSSLVPVAAWGLGRGHDPLGQLPTVPRERAAVVQFTSGSTDEPKGVVLSHASILEAIESASVATGVSSHSDRLAGWLPFFHDYGLFGFMVRPFALGLDAHVLPVARFLRDPRRWFQLLTSTRATMTAAPCSAWAAALRCVEPDQDLSSLRLGVIAAESIDPTVLRALQDAAPTLGLDPGAIVTAYGLAEATLGVSATTAGGVVRIDTVDRDLLAAGRAVEVQPERPHRAVVSCGAVFDGLEVAITPADAEEPSRAPTLCAEREVGEVLIRGPSLLTGYLVDGALHDPRTSDGWVRTGDLGYLADGELCITGRSKEVLIVHGSNHAPEEVERVAESLQGVRPGRSVAFTHPIRGDGHLVLLIELVEDGSPAGLVHDVRAAVAKEVGLLIEEVLIVPRGTVRKTSSGKLQRRAMQQAFGAGTLPLAP